MKNAIYFLVIFVAFSIEAYSAERIESKSFQKVYEVVMKKKDKWGASQVLVVYDFDNTLMAMDRDLGSDQWYNWQQNALKSNNKKEAYFKSSADLFDTHYQLFALIGMHPVEEVIPKIVRELQQADIKSIVLTSRGSILRNDTEIELERGGFDFVASAIGPGGGFAGRLKPDNIENPRSVTYQDGLLLGSGQNKGLLLEWLLQKTNTRFKSIIFVDDTLKNIENVEAVYRDNPEVVTIFYTHEVSRVEAFQRNKKQAQRDWNKFKKLFDEFKIKSRTQL